MSSVLCQNNHILTFLTPGSNKERQPRENCFLNCGWFHCWLRISWRFWFGSLLIIPTHRGLSGSRKTSLQLVKFHYRNLQKVEKSLRAWAKSPLTLISIKLNVEHLFKLPIRFLHICRTKSCTQPGTEHSQQSQSQAAIDTINKLHIHGDIDNSPAVRGLLQLYKWGSCNCRLRVSSCSRGQPGSPATVITPAALQHCSSNCVQSFTLQLSSVI